MQRRQRFRDSKKDNGYYLWLEDENMDYQWKWKNEAKYPPDFTDQLPSCSIEEIKIEQGQNNYFWFNLSATKIYAQLLTDLNEGRTKENKVDLKTVSRRFGEVRIVQYSSDRDEDYFYHPNLGLFKI